MDSLRAIKRVAALVFRRPGIGQIMPFRTINIGGRREYFDLICFATARGKKGVPLVSLAASFDSFVMLTQEYREHVDCAIEMMNFSPDLKEMSRKSSRPALHSGAIH